MRQRVAAIRKLRGVVACGLLVVMTLATCRDRPPAVVEVQVVQVGFDAAVGAPVVVLESADARRLPIWIGPAEADAISRELRGLTPPRPMTHDLMVAILGSLHAELARVRITELREETFYAVLEIERGGQITEVDCRPSDGIALALRVGCPIVVSRGLLERVAPAAARRSAALGRTRLTKFRAMA